MRLGTAWRPLLAIFGGTPGNSFVDVGPEEVRFRFGFTFDQRIPRTQIESAVPVKHSWWMGIGWRLGPDMVGLIGDSAGVVEVRLRQPRHVRLIGIPWRYQKLRVSLQDSDAFINDVTGS